MAENQIQTKTYPVQTRLKPTSSKLSKSPESKYWRSYKFQEITNLIYPITSLSFSPTSPHNFITSFSASLTLYNAQTIEPISTFSSFNDIAYSPAFRSDGKLVAAGGETGLVQVFDVKTRLALRKLRGHSRPVRFVSYPCFDKLHLFSGGDDSLVKYWDVVSEMQLLNFQGHKDYVRCGSASPGSSELFATGSYDHTVKIWDSRTSSTSMKYVMEFNHGKPVEDVVFLPSGGLIATAGGNSVKIWDVIGGGKLVYTMESHNKTVTSLCVGKLGRNEGEEYDQFRLMSVSLDGYMKVFDYSALKLTHSMRFPQPLLSIGFSPDCSTRVIGTSNGVIYVGKRKNKETSNVESGVGELIGFSSVPEPQKQVLRPNNFRYFSRGQNEKPSKVDHVIERPRKPKTAEHDKLLRKFRHKEALVSALNRKEPRSVMAVLEELVARRKLLKCVSNLDIEELGLLMRFLHKYTTMPSYSGFLIGFTKKVLQMHAEDVNASDVLKWHVRQLKLSVEEEIHTHQSLQEIQGHGLNGIFLLTFIFTPNCLSSNHVGKGRILIESERVALLGYGTAVQSCVAAASLVEQHGLRLTVADARFCKPLDQALIRRLANSHEVLITVEVGSIGSVGSHVAHFLALNGLFDGKLKWRPLVLPDRYIEHGSPVDQMMEAGMTPSHIAATIFNLLGQTREAQRKKYVKRSVGIFPLTIPHALMATGQVLFHRFYCKKSFARFSVKRVAVSCVWLASKLEESPKKTRHVILVFNGMECRRENLPIEHFDNSSKKYVYLKQDLIKTERHLLKEMGFICHVEHPHKFISNYLATLETPPELRQPRIPVDLSSRGELPKESLTDEHRNSTSGKKFCNECNFNRLISVRHKINNELPPNVCIQLYVCNSKVKLSLVELYMQLHAEVPLPENPPWWKAFDADKSGIDEVCRVLAHLYSLPKAQYVPVCQEGDSFTTSIGIPTDHKECPLMERQREDPVLKSKADHKTEVTGEKIKEKEREKEREKEKLKARDRDRGRDSERERDREIVERDRQTQGEKSSIKG
ncbi:hypothetical protein IFM89_012181 [Coptis chinensis]|uniref:Cyclin-like domain-containing protein n=1 Tax=Coptis chinensis TaxID=261450 RepID=A0A835HAT4_9MAGN|nr:hypothetical protein IFM89_012181 [Coptis chinensis]